MFPACTPIRTLIAGLAIVYATQSIQAQPTVRSQAVVNFTFDEVDGLFRDTASVGQTVDEAKPENQPARVSSPFWNQTGKRAVQFDGSKQQYLEIADGPDVDHTTGLTFGMFVVNLQDPSDASYHGLIAKRGQVEGRIFTNYGINFAQQGDTLQVYLSDGSGYKITHFSTQAAIPTRKLTYLTVTYHVADAPGQDADTEVDDVRIQLFANGEPVKPKAAPNGLIEGNDAWILDVNPAGLVNSLPLTIGRSEATAGEYFTGVVDEFSLFPHVLNGEQVKQLFTEVAGANVRELMAMDGPASVKAPVIQSLSQPAITIGQSTILTLTGSGFSADTKLVFPISTVQVDVKEALPGKLTVEVTASQETVSGQYPCWVSTTDGISNPATLVFDRFQQLPIPATGPEAPVTLPAAFFGTLAGSAQPRIYFQGKKGQRIVADVELKRLGGAANPVLEIKTSGGTPLAIGWGHHSFRGDTRAEVIIPHDGLYAIELHDLTYNAPGASVFRLKAGELKLVDAVMPAIVAGTQAQLVPIGTGVEALPLGSVSIQRLQESQSGLLQLVNPQLADGPLPLVKFGASREILEAATENGTPQQVKAVFSNPADPELGISGQLLKRGERDKFLLEVTPGQTLQMTLQTRSLFSTIDGELTLFQHPQGNVLAISAEQPAATDVTLDYTVPAGQTQILVVIRDLLNRGGERAFYRLQIRPKPGPAFELQQAPATINVSSGGSSLVELQVNRQGYEEPIALRLSGTDGIAVAPSQIPAGIQGKVLLRLSQAASASPGTTTLVRLLGLSVGTEPAVVRAAQIVDGNSRPGFEETLAIGTSGPAGLAVELATVPTVLFRGVPYSIPVALQRQPGSESASRPIRLAMTTTEAPRLKVANNPAAGNQPLVALVPSELIPPETSQSSVSLLAPLESVEPSIDIAIRAEAIAHAYSERVQAVAHAIPFRVQIQNAVAPKAEDATLAIVTGSDHLLTGQLQRAAGFTGPVEVTIVGLPGDYQVTPATVAGDQGAFIVAIKAPKIPAEQAIANVRLRVTSQGSLLVPEMPLAVKALPPKP